MAETFTFGKIGKEDLYLGHGTFTTDLPDGSSATLNKVGAHTFLGMINVVNDYGAYNDDSVANMSANVTAITNAIAAAAAAGYAVYFPPGTYRINAKIPVASPVFIFGDSAYIKMDFPVATASADGMAFYVTASNVGFERLWFTATAATTLSGHRYGIYALGTSGAYLNNLYVGNCLFTSLGQYAGTRPAFTYYNVGTYLQYVEDSLFWANRGNLCTGPLVDFRNTRRLVIAGCTTKNVETRPISGNNDNYGIEICHNRIVGGDPQASGGSPDYPIYNGGGIEIMGQTVSGGGGGYDARINIHDNYLTGKFWYYAAMRCESTKGLRIHHNTFDQCTVYSTSDAAGYNHGNDIVITVRDITGYGSNNNNGPANDVLIDGNLFVAKGTLHRGIFCITTSGAIAWPDCNRERAKGLTVVNNDFVCVDASNYFMQCLYVHGYDQGWDDIVITGNRMNGTPLTDANACPVPGLIVLASYAAKAGPPASTPSLENILIEANILSQYGSEGSTSSHCGIYISKDVKNLKCRHNLFDSFYYGVYVEPSADASVESCLDNTFIVSGSGAAPRAVSWGGVWGAAAVDLHGTISGTATPSLSLALSAGGTFDITVLGAVVGDAVSIIHPSAIAAGVICDAYVSATNVVTVRVFNAFGANPVAVNTEFRAIVRKR